MGWIFTLVLPVIWATLALFYSRNDLLNEGDLLKEDNLLKFQLLNRDAVGVLANYSGVAKLDLLQDGCPQWPQLANMVWWYHDFLVTRVLQMSTCFFGNLCSEQALVVKMDVDSSRWLLKIVVTCKLIWGNGGDSLDTSPNWNSGVVELLAENYFLWLL